MGVNLKEELLRHRRKHTSGKEILDQVFQVLQNDTNHEEAIHSQLAAVQNSNNNSFNLDLLETDRIFHLKDIKNICITYRLRFLDSNLFKADIPREAISEIKQLEKGHKTTLEGFKIMAPSKSFRLKNYDDPLLFAPIGNGYFYLIHKWGNDLSIYRKWQMWPFKNFENLLFTAIFLSLVLTLAVPNSLVDYSESAANFFLLFMFMIKWVIGITIYYSFAKGKNFNTAIWDSKYSNA